MTVPHDTSVIAWSEQISALARLGPEGRVEVAADLSEAVRSIQLDGIQARHPAWTHQEVIRHRVKSAHGIQLPSTR